MRKPRYRGKRKDNDKWVYGSCCVDKSGDPIIIDDVLVLPNGALCFSHYFVRKGTVGECTGISDINQKLIYEGDVVRYYDSYLRTEENNNCVGAIYYDPDRCEFRMTSNDYGFSIRKGSLYEVIGNIYDGHKKGEEDE